VNQVLTMIIGDFVLVGGIFLACSGLSAYVLQIYRCWVVYGRRWPIITPSLLLFLGSIGIAIKVVETECNPATTRTITLNSIQLRPWYATLFGLNAVQNFLTTGEVHPSPQDE
jgi:hypothetical protein